MRIFFIRHGQTTGDVENRYGGAYDDHLTVEGQQHSQGLAEALADKGIEIIYSSSLVRAQETAEALAVQFKCITEVAPNLKERDQYAFLSGMYKEEALQKYPDEVEMLKDRLNTIPGAESYDDFSMRISNAFAEVCKDAKYSTIAIVSHGGPMRVLFRDILKWGELTEIGNCSYVELSLEDGVYSYIASQGLSFDFDISIHAQKHR